MGARYQETRRDSPFKNATSPGELVEATGNVPYLMGNGLHILPDDLTEAVRFAPKRNGRAMKAFWEKHVIRLRGAAKALPP